MTFSWFSETWTSTATVRSRSKSSFPVTWEWGKLPVWLEEFSPSRRKWKRRKRKNKKFLIIYIKNKKIFLILIFSLTCVQRPPSGPRRYGHCWLVVVVQSFSGHSNNTWHFFSTSDPRPSLPRCDNLVSKMAVFKTSTYSWKCEMKK